MRFYPENEINVSFDYTAPWDTKPWFKPCKKPKRRKRVSQEFPTIYEHYRIIDFTPFNPPEITGPAGKKKSKKPPKAPPGYAKTMCPFKQLPPHEVIVDRINPITGLIFCRKRGGQWIKLTMPDPYGIQKVPLPLALKDIDCEEA